MPPLSEKFGHNFKLRLLSALVLLPACVGIVFMGGPLYLLAFAAIIAVAGWEWMRLCFMSPLAARRATVIFFTALLVVSGCLLAGEMLWAFVAVALCALAQIDLKGAAPSPANQENKPHSHLLAVIGSTYLLLNIIAVWQLRTFVDFGRDLVMFVFIAVWAVDIGAYFSGRLIGGPKLAPKLSPNKTWAGAIGGAVAAALFGFLWAYVAGAREPLIAVALAAPITFFAQGGDLLESMLKRRSGAKDASGIIPGHGGILDRIDGLLMMIPVFTLFQMLLGPLLGWW